MKKVQANDFVALVKQNRTNDLSFDLFHLVSSNCFDDVLENDSTFHNVNKFFFHCEKFFDILLVFYSQDEFSRHCFVSMANFCIGSIGIDVE